MRSSQQRRVDGCTTSTVASSLLPRSRANSTSRAQRSPSGAEVRRTRAISPAAACRWMPSLHKTSISPADELDLSDVRCIDGAVADHPRGIVRAPAGRRPLIEVPIGVVDGEKLGPVSARRTQSIHAAVADPRDQPLRAPCIDRDAQRDRRCAGRARPPRDAPRDLAVRSEDRCPDRGGTDAAATEHRMNVRHELAARARRQRARADAVRDDEESRVSVERTVFVFVHGMLPPARRRDGRMNASPSRCRHRFAHARGAAGARARRRGRRRHADRFDVGPHSTGPQPARDSVSSHAATRSVP